MSHLWELGFGAVSIESLIYLEWSGITGLHLSVIVANSAPVISSFLFLTYNSLFTCMLSEKWSGYAHDWKPLRVTSPIGSQRTTCMLQLPYRYGIPLLIVSSILHWFVSQSIFLARISLSAAGEEGFYGSVSTVGYSCMAIITVICAGGIVVFIGILNDFRRYKPGMPLMGSNRAAISAACHRPNEDVGCSIQASYLGELLKRMALSVTVVLRASR